MQRMYTHIFVHVEHNIQRIMFIVKYNPRVDRLETLTRKYFSSRHCVRVCFYTSRVERPIWFCRQWHP